MSYVGRGYVGRGAVRVCGGEGSVNIETQPTVDKLDDLSRVGVTSSQQGGSRSGLILI